MSAVVLIAEKQAAGCFVHDAAKNIKGSAKRKNLFFMFCIV